MAYIATNKSVRPAISGRIGAYILSLLFAIFTVNLIISFADINIFNLIGKYSGIVVSLIEAVAAALLFFSIKAWLPVKISATIYWLPSIVSSFFFAKIKDAAALAEKTADYTIMERIFNATEICDYFSLALSILTIILTIIWMNMKTIAPHAQSNSIDII